MRNDIRARNHPSYWAFVVHRVSGFLLATGLLCSLVAMLCLSTIPDGVVQWERGRGRLPDASAIEARWIGRALWAGSLGIALLTVGALLRCVAPSRR